MNFAKRRARGLDVRIAVAGLTVGLISFVAIFAILGSLAQPLNIKARLARIESLTARAEAATRARGDADAYPPGTVCEGGAGMGADALRRRVEMTLGQANLSLAKVSVTPGEAKGALTPVQLRLEASGGYDAVMLALGQLRAQQPRIFLDTVDMKPKAAMIDLTLAGRVMCWTPAAP